MLLKKYELSDVLSKETEDAGTVYNVHTPQAAGGDLLFACTDEESAYALARSIDGNTKGYWKQGD